MQAFLRTVFHGYSSNISRCVLGYLIYETHSLRPLRGADL